MNSKRDAQIRQEVLRELRRDIRIEEIEVGVEVEKGVVTLTGTVSSHAKKSAAREAVYRVSGVLDVANEIRVKVPGSLGRTDTEIALAVRRALEWEAMVPNEWIRSTVADGWVTLEGTVEYEREREDAERAVCHLPGVKGVHNKLLVSPVKITPKDVRMVIEDALECRADREAERITVKVNDGMIALSGYVHSWAEKRAVIGAVSHTPGVLTVKDQLRISPIRTP